MADEMAQLRAEQARRYAEHKKQQVAPTAATVPQSQPTVAAAQAPPPAAPPVVESPVAAAPPRPMIGLPGHDSNLTADEIEQRERAARKNEELERHNRSYDADRGGNNNSEPYVRPPAQSDQPRVMRLADLDGAPEPMPDLSDMLREAQAEMQAMGINVDDMFQGMDEEIEREIDANLAADMAGGRIEPDAQGNVLQLFDHEGRDMVAEAVGAEAAAFDPQNTGESPQRTIDPSTFDKYSIVSTLANAKSLNKENKQCAVCQDELKDGDVVRRLNCMHVFHRECVDEWLRRCAKCPVCKHEFDEGQQLMDGLDLKNPRS
jgi:hypothetical protein